MNGITTLPAFFVELDGESLSQAELFSVDEVVIAQKLSSPSMCEISFLHPARDLVRCGESLRVFVGPQKRMVFSGGVTAIEHEY